MFKASRVENSNNVQVQRLELSAFIPKFKHFISSKKSLLIPVLLCLAYYSYYVIYKTNRDQQQTRQIVAIPKINDIYLFDFRIVSHNLRPNEKYRIAKVVDITGDIITLVYGSFYYPNQHATINSIYYGQLTYKDYFEAKRFDYNHQEIQQKLASGAIYQAMRPINDKLLGQRVGPEPRKYRSNIFIQGRRENLTGEAFLNQRFSETNLKQAFELFTTSANYNFAQGQVNLAQMYINGQYVEKNLSKALYWLNQAALQSHKPAILKYEIVCKQLSSCQIYDFFKNLVATGVNVKVRNLSTELTVEH
ncbi:sel1 repeat family protein [Colwellia sp. MB3u-70]|uniref:tetratricopeptide repeat protein n=1 Tax=unclassified Colwellia TaxID=196834 RepID=UPI0015F397D6|nr:MULTISPECIES: tetratricopeptide repeat protein [unclassified Colwellia]MBA6293727.1 sel1 repeat family protein [Colwellia sp. MB3u-8]MBA6308846.1 sel1 repeat family protein [Colwellia sp. MB3u-70]